MGHITTNGGVVIHHNYGWTNIIKEPSVVVTAGGHYTSRGSGPSLATTVTQLDCSSHCKPLVKRGLETDTRKPGSQIRSFSLTNSIFSTSGHHIFKPFP
ncbi:hypothetical protein E2C01_020185 [Portunus trituberculatus]|uniref:Uncharacterized protein n=1 Tax=Portunus trituberculatus TaxID=210409 RepID=A0A5B7E1D8_PORTR|nr:hypothetical protein [Portunus trituberculatus]